MTDLNGKEIFFGVATVAVLVCGFGAFVKLLPDPHHNIELDAGRWDCSRSVQEEVAHTVSIGGRVNIMTQMESVCVEFTRVR